MRKHQKRRRNRVVAWLIALVALAWCAYALYGLRTKQNTQKLLSRAEDSAASGAWDEAATEYRQYLQRKPDDVAVLHAYADVLFEQMKTSPEVVDDAARTLQRLVGITPDDVETTQRLTNLYLQVHKFELAEGLATAWTILAPDSVDACLSLALAQHRLRKDREAASTLLAAVGRIPGEPSLFPLLIKLLGENLNRPEEALRWLNEALRVGSDVLDIRIAAFAFFESQGQLDEAEKHLHRALDLAPESLTTLLPAGAFYVSQGRLDEARALLDRAAAVDPADPNVLTVQAKWALKAGNIPFLKAAADGFAKLGGESNPRFIAQAGELYLRTGSMEQVDACLAKLSALPLASTTMNAQVETLMGGRALRRSEPYEAIRHLRAALEQDPSAAWTLEMLATAYAQIQDLDASTDVYRQLIARAPNDVGARLRAAEIAWQQGRLTDARNADAGFPRSGDGLLPPAFELIRLACDLRKAESEGRPLDASGAWRNRLEQLAAGPAVDEVSARWLMRCHALAGEPERSLDFYRRQVRGAGVDSKLGWELGHLLLSAGRGAMALELGDELVRQFPNAAEGYVLRVRSLSSLGRLQEAAAAGADHGAMPAAVRAKVIEAIADGYANAGEIESGLDWYRQAADIDLEGISCRRKLARYAPTFDEALKRSAELRAIEGEDGVFWKFEEAGALLRFQPNDDAPTQARHLLQQCLADRPRWSSARLMLGYACEMAGAWREAADAYESAIGSEPALRYHPVAIRLIGVLNRLGKLAQADALLDTIAGLQPHEPEILRLQTEQRVRMGDLDSAITTAERLLALTPDDPALTVAAAELHLRVGNPDRAETIVRALLADHPGSMSVLWSLARALIAQDRAVEAEQVIRAAAHEFNDASHALLLATVLARIGKNPEAEQAVIRAQELAPTDAQVWAACADFWRSVNHRSQQVACTRRAVELRGEDPLESLELATLLATNGTVEERGQAADVVQRRLTRNPQDAAALLLDGQLAVMKQPPDLVHGEASLTRCLAIDPNVIPAYKLLSSVHVYAGRLKAARDVIDAGLAFAPVDPELLQASARVHSIRGDDDRAIPILKQLLEIEPRLPAALRLLASAYANTDQADRAIAYIEAQAPENAWTPEEMVILAKLYESKNRMDRAEALFRRANALDQDATDIHRELVQFLARARRFDEIQTLASSRRGAQPNDVESLAIAAEILCSLSEDAGLRDLGMSWLEAISRDAPEHSTDANYRSAVCHYKQGRLEAAEQKFLEALRQAPTHSRSVNDLAWLYSEDRGEPEKAAALIERFLSMGGTEDAHLLDTHCVVLIHLGRFDDAEQLALKCLQVAGNTPTRTAATFHLGVSLIKSGRADNAMPHLRQALQLHERRGGLTPAEEQELRRLLTAELTGNDGGPRDNEG